MKGVAKQGRHGWHVDFNGFTSAMPDETTAKQCAVAGELAKALEWAMPYAELGHELGYPGETYEKDNYVAKSVKHARDTLAVVADLGKPAKDRPRYRVIVGNLGTVYEGWNPVAARAVYGEYKRLSEAEVGRAGGESVTLFDGDDIAAEHAGKIDS